MKKWLMLLITLFSFTCAFSAVNINTATTQELQTLPYIGPAKAQAIVDYRKEKGAFKTIEDITQVKGIGKATFEKLKGEITVNGAKAAAAEKNRTAKPIAKTEKKAGK